MNWFPFAGFQSTVVIIGEHWPVDFSLSWGLEPFPSDHWQCLILFKRINLNSDFKWEYITTGRGFSSPCIPGLIIVECWNVVPCEFYWDFPFIGMGGIASMPPLTAVAPVPMGSIPVVGMSPPLVSSVPAAGVPPLANGAPPVIQPLPAFAHPGMWPAKATGWSSICILLVILIKSSVFTLGLYLHSILFQNNSSFFFFHLMSHFGEQLV